MAVLRKRNQTAAHFKFIGGRMENLILRMENGTITNNLDLYEASIMEALKKYDYIVTDENYQNAIEDKRHIKGEVEKIKRERIDFEKEMLESWTPIKKRLMAVEKKIEASENALDQQIKELDDQKKEEKKALIKQVYDAYGLPIDFEKILDKSWLNKSCANTKWKKELEEKVAKIKQDMTMIELFQPFDKADALQVQNKYFETLDLTLAKAKADELKALREKASQMAEKEAQKEIPIAPVIENTDFKQEMEMEFDEPKMKRVEAILTGSFEFFDEMNQLVKKYDAQCKVLKKEVI